jgi:iduronate 2-sulfatase
MKASRGFLALALVALALVASLCVLLYRGAEPRRQYNVLFIISDDMRPELGAYGNQIIKTPNIDKLASWGVRFDAAYAQVPLCNPSRTSMLTGRYPTQTGVLDEQTWFGAAHPDFVSLPKYFKQQGYVTLRTGKVFHAGVDGAGVSWGADDTEAWSVGGIPRRPIDGTNTRKVPADGDPSTEPGSAKRTFEGAAKTTVQGGSVDDSRRDSGTDPAAPTVTPAPLSAYDRYSDRIVALEGNGEGNEDYGYATRAIELLEEYKDKPFFLAVGFIQPHSPPTAPRKMIEMYDATKIPLPVDFAPRPQAPAGFPALSIPPRNGDLFVGRDASEQEAREMIRAYYAAITFTDANVGRVLDELERLKLRERTIIVFWADHGYHLGEKGKWSKHGSLFEVGTRVPLLIVLPGAKGNGQASPRVVESLDIYPTLTDLCGLPLPAGLMGQSLRPLLDNPKAKWRKPAYMMTEQGKAVRTERWRYAEWNDGSAMLFDHTRDPHELENLANDPAHAETVAKMKRLLRRGLPAAACPNGQRVALKKPYHLRSGYGYTANLPELQQISDSMQMHQRSTVVLCEDGLALGPAHSLHVEIQQLGRGRFSHWGTDVVFSASDNSDPNTNGREYVAVLPD